MSNCRGAFLRTVATKTVVAALPVALTCAYASGLFVPPSPRPAAYEYRPVAEITVSGSTVGLADSNLYFLTDPTLTIEPERVAQHLDQMQSLGIENIRVYVPWRFVETTKGEYDWSSMDVIMSLAAERDMGVLAEMNTTPAWVDPAGEYEFGAAHPNPDDFRDFASAVATRYGATVSAYEIWNEPNWVGFYDPVDPAAYAELLKAVYPALKEIDPTATIVAAGLGHTPTYADGSTLSPVEFLDGMYQAGAKGYFDALAYHPYQYSTPFSQSTQDGYALDQALAMVALMAGNGDYVTGPNGQPLLDANGERITKRIWATEYGLPTSRVSYEHQASYIRDFLATWSPLSWAGPAYVYTTVDSNPGSNDPEENFGVFTVDANGNWVRKPAADVLAEWILAHPNQTFTPADPVQQTNPLAAFVVFIQQLVAQFSHTTLSFVNAVVTAITNFLGSFARPVATEAPPTTQRVAFETKLDGPSAAPIVEAKADTVDATKTPSETLARVRPVLTTADAAEPASAEALVAESVATESVATESVVTTPAVTEPAGTEPTVPELDSTAPTDEVVTPDTDQAAPPTKETDSSQAKTTAPEKTADSPERTERPEPTSPSAPSTPAQSTTAGSTAREDGNGASRGASASTSSNSTSSGSDD